MKRTINHICHTRYLGLTCVLFLLCLSCMDDTSCPPIEGDTRVVLTISVPNAGLSRALSVTDENNVTQIDAFIYDASGTFLEYQQGENLTDNIGGDVTRKSFSLQVMPGTYNFIILANSRTYINDMIAAHYPGGDIPPTTTVAEIQSRLEFENTGKWNPDNATPGYRHIPMWGESYRLRIERDGTLSNNDPVKMIRAIAKINILIDQSIQSRFQLKSASLYNYSVKGTVIPLATAWDSNEALVTAPSLPTGHTLTKGPLVYTQDDLPVGTSITTGLTSTIYTLEAPKGNDAGFPFPDFPCIVVEGTYMPDGKDYFYRVNFETKDHTDNLHLLRNHHYEITIEGVDGPGSDTKDKAYESIETNLFATIYTWDLNNIGAEPGKNYYLRVHPGVVELDARSFGTQDTENRITIQTDYPGGWTIDPASIELPDGSPAPWLTLDKLDGGRDVAAEVHLLLESNSTGVQRTATFTVKAGPISYPVQVIQGIVGLQDITITPTGDIPAAGQQRTVTADGFFTNLAIRAWNATDDVLIHNNTIAGTSDPKSNTLNVPLLWNEADRTIQREIMVNFQYQHPVLGQWQSIRTDIQYSYYLKHELETRQDPYVDAPRFLWLYLWGYYPDLMVRVWSTDTNAVIGNGHITLPAADISLIDRTEIELGRNLNGNYRVEYSEDNGVTWKPMPT